MLIKLGENLDIIKEEQVSSCTPLVGDEILERFQKFATNLKKIAPKAEDFLYFSCVMMHAAESCAINDDGTQKLTARGEPVQVSWDNSGGNYRWVSNDPNIRPTANCFIPGTKILLEDGSTKAIEEIVVGDMVITHNGRSRKVLKTFITPHSGNLLQIRVRNNEKITCTSNHPFYHVNFDDFSIKTKGLKKLTERKKNNENFRTSFKFSEAEKLEVGDILLSPVLHTKIESNLNPNKARLLGLFAAEGSFSKKYGKLQGVHFTIGIHEERLALSIKEAFDEEFPECSVKICPEPTRSVININASGYNIAEYFYYHTGEYSHKKILSKEIVFSDDDTKKAFISGWLDGDGCLGNENRLIGITVSPHLASQIRIMLNSLKIGNSIRKGDKCKRKFPDKDGYKEYDCREHYRTEIYGNAYQKLDLEKLTAKYKFGNFSHRTIANFEQDYGLHSIKEITKVLYTGNVYNFEVEEDNTYVANGIVVHNCNHDIFPEEELIKAHKKWIHKPLCIDHKSSSVDHVRGFIVDTYYDRQLKRVVALCALDKISFPQLARQISTKVSTAVSMGTAVGRAICFDCGRVARAEQDFCQHMKAKSGYGEINIDLNPLELSIVVNGADPKAHIKHVLAAANTLNTYLENKEQEIKKLADLKFNASINVLDPKGDENVKASTLYIESNTLEDFKKDIESACNQLSNIYSLAKNAPENVNDSNNTSYNQSSGSLAMSEQAPAEGLSPNSPQTARFAQELTHITSTIENRLNQIKLSLNKLSNLKETFYKEENNMSNDLNKKGYFQGGGGVNEPTPGQVKYPKDPLNENLREYEDKQMVGQSPFPEVGPVDGMHPSPASADPSNELERKKMLARAESEERALRRTAIVNLAKQALQEKQAYWLGGGGVNEPTPGKVKYPKDKLNEEAREYEDKQMVGQPPFPQVGKVDGLHPSPSSADEKDEYKRKKTLQRAASLHARFVKAANQDGTSNFGKSAWEVFLGDKLLLTASVEDLSGGQTNILYDSIATKEFGVKLLEKVKANGADAVKALIKKAQVAPPAPPPPVDAEPPAPPSDMSAPEDTGKEGDPKDTALELSEKVRDLSSDLVDAVHTLTGEKVEMGNMEGAPMAAAASKETASLQKMRFELNDALTSAMKEAVAELKSHQNELEMLAGIYSKNAVNKENKDLVKHLTDDAFSEAKSAIADGFKLMEAFVKYASGTEAVVKRAAMEVELSKLAQDAGGGSMDNDSSYSADNDLMSLLHDSGSELNDVKSLMSDEDKEHDGEGLDTDLDLSMDALTDENNMQVQVAPGEMVPKDLPSNTTVEVKHASYDTKEGRQALRAKLAADATGKEDDGEVRDASKIKFNDVLEQADRLADGQTQLDVKPSDNLGLIETPAEKNKAMLEVAKAPPKVRKEAETIQRMVSSGKLDPKDLDALVAQGLDKDAVSYWKKYYGQVDGGSEFASELVKEHVKAQMEVELNKYRVKLARSFELAYDMVDRGYCHRERNAISHQVDEIMKYNDDSFESLKRVISQQQPLLQKAAGKIPQVGYQSSDEDYSNSLNQNSDQDDFNQLSSMFGHRKGNF